MYLELRSPGPDKANIGMSPPPWIDEAPPCVVSQPGTLDRGNTLPVSALAGHAAPAVAAWAAGSPRLPELAFCLPAGGDKAGISAYVTLRNAVTCGCSWMMLNIQLAPRFALVRVSASASRAVLDTPRVRRLGEGKLPNDLRAASRAHPTSKTQERGGRVPGFSTGVQKDVGVSSQPFRVVRRRDGAAAMRPGRSARPRSRTAPRSRSTGSAAGRRTASRPPRWSRRRWTAGRARTP